MRILVTGGAGFVGSYIIRELRERMPGTSFVAIDNLRRRGSELNVRLFKDLGVPFIHGDLRCASDLEDLPGTFDCVIDACAEPSVMAGTDSPNYVIQTNLTGTVHCMEFLRKRAGSLIFLSTSRVYSLAALRNLKLTETDTRFMPNLDNAVPGLSALGISENFDLTSARTFYGATKLASELLIKEYSHFFPIPSVINRCGVILGPGQFGKVDQGVFSLWLMNHYFKRPIQYLGFNGKGKQVRDLLHPADLCNLIMEQMKQISTLRGETFNVGGGIRASMSLHEMTALCRELTGNQVKIESEPTTHPTDVPWYISDHTKATERFAWSPKRTVRDIAKDALNWIQKHRSELERHVA